MMQPSFTRVLVAMKNSVMDPLPPAEFLEKRGQFEDQYAEHRQQLAKAFPHLAKMTTPDFDRRLRKLVRLGRRSAGTTVAEVEKTLGCDMGEFREYLTHFAVDDNHALIYTGNGKIDLIPFRQGNTQ